MLAISKLCTDRGEDDGDGDDDDVVCEGDMIRMHAFDFISEKAEACTILTPNEIKMTNCHFR